jgi:HEAT repeat protein
MKRAAFGFILASTFSPVVVSAALPNKGAPAVVTEKQMLKKDIEIALTALQLPPSNRNKALKSQGVHSLGALQAIALDSQQPLTLRWRATTSLGRVYPKESTTFLAQLTTHPEWFLRNSSLLALKVASPQRAIHAAEHLIKDKSLIVRTAAVQTLSDLNAAHTHSLLWEALNSKQNFRGHESLWVRQHIMKALSQFQNSKDLPRFAEALRDRDVKVQLWAMQGLEKVSQVRIGTKNTSFAERRQKWLAWVEMQNLKAR